jgi:putative ABC transport system permease protein
VRAASLAQFAPMDFSSNGGRIYVPGHETRGTDAGAEVAGWAEVAPGFFDALGTQLAAGRDFSERDDSAAPAVAIVNETMAHRYWPGQDALGRQFRMRAPDSALVTVIGVAHDMKYNNLVETPTPFVYRPLTQEYQGYATLVVRTATAAPRALAPAITGVVTGLDPEMSWDVRTFADLMSGRALILPRFGAALAGGFGVLALLLASIGLYGVVAYGVSQRTREIGIRVALGADRAAVLRMVVRGGLGQAVLGLGIGCVLAIGATRALRSLLFGVGAADPLTYVAVAALLTAVAAFASWLPARRATRVDPTITMRAE